jgi:hypothetical protein
MAARKKVAPALAAGVASEAVAPVKRVRKHVEPTAVPAEPKRRGRPRKELPPPVDIDNGRAPAQYTVQMVALLDAETGGTIRAALEHQRKKDRQRTQASVLRDVIELGLREIMPRWTGVKRYGARPGTLRATREAATS